MKPQLASAMVIPVILGPIQPAAAQPATEAARNITVFAGEVRLPTAGAATPMKVEVKDWSVGRTRDGLQIPAQGFYVVQLRSGMVVTEIDGKSEKRKPGDFWTVTAGVPMSVALAPRGEAAQLRTIAINPGP